MADTNAKRSKRRSRIFIVDDHVLIRRGLKALLDGEKDLECCGDAPDTETALKKLNSAKPDLMIIDFALEEGTGIELIKRMKAQAPDVKLLVFSMHVDPLYADRSLKAGAMGYIGKREGEEKVIKAIRQVLGGEIYLDQVLEKRLVNREPGGKPRDARLPVDTLTNRELEIFERIGHGQKTREIAETLGLSVKTIEAHREKIKRKLNLVNAVELTRHAVEWVLGSR